MASNTRLPRGPKGQTSLTSPTASHSHSHTMLSRAKHYDPSAQMGIGRFWPFAGKPTHWLCDCSFGRLSAQACGDGFVVSNYGDKLISCMFSGADVAIKLYGGGSPDELCQEGVLPTKCNSFCARLLWIVGRICCTLFAGASMYLSISSPCLA